MASVGIRDVKKAFGSTQVIRGVDIPSATANSSCWSAPPAGCGKSALLGISARLENITGGEQIVAVFRGRHQFNAGEKVRLKPDPMPLHLFDEATGKRVNA